MISQTSHALSTIKDTFISNASALVGKLNPKTPTGRATLALSGVAITFALMKGYNALKQPAVKPTTTFADNVHQLFSRVFANLRPAEFQAAYTEVVANLAARQPFAAEAKLKAEQVIRQLNNNIDPATISDDRYSSDSVLYTEEAAVEGEGDPINVMGTFTFDISEEAGQDGAEATRRWANVSLQVGNVVIDDKQLNERIINENMKPYLIWMAVRDLLLLADQTNAV